MKYLKYYGLFILGVAVVAVIDLSLGIDFKGVGQGAKLVHIGIYVGFGYIIGKLKHPFENREKK